MRFSLLSCLALTLLPAHAAEEKTTGVDLALISETATIAPGKPFTVALKVHHHPGYHTYSQSPGIVGVPFAIAWKLPEGFTAGPIQWPYPEQVDMAGHPAHGYERDILLLVDITPPATISASSTALTATASWMACADGCHPGKKTFNLSLSVGPEAKADPANAPTIVKARAELPRPLVQWTAVVESAADAAEIRVKFTRTGEQATDPGRVYFFSTDGQISSSPPQKIEPIEGGFRLIAERAEFGPKGATTLPGVLVGGKSFAKDQPAYGTVTPAYPTGATVSAPTQ